MKYTHEKGAITLPVLLYCLLLLQLVVGSLPFFDNTGQIAVAERNKLQAGYNAEAGIWLALRDWSSVPESHTTLTYSLPSGMVKVVVDTIGSGNIQLKSFGTAFDGKDGVEIIYNVMEKQITHWHRIIIE